MAVSSLYSHTHPKWFVCCAVSEKYAIVRGKSRHQKWFYEHITGIKLALEFCFLKNIPAWQRWWRVMNYAEYFLPFNVHSTLYDGLKDSLWILFYEKSLCILIEIEFFVYMNNWWIFLTFDASILATYRAEYFQFYIFDSSFANQIKLGIVCHRWLIKKLTCIE